MRLLCVYRSSYMTVVGCKLGATNVIELEVERFIIWVRHQHYSPVPIASGLVSSSEWSCFNWRPYVAVIYISRVTWNFCEKRKYVAKIEDLHRPPMTICMSRHGDIVNSYMYCPRRYSEAPSHLTDIDTCKLSKVWCYLLFCLQGCHTYVLGLA